MTAVCTHRAVFTRYDGQVPGTTGVGTRYFFFAVDIREREHLNTGNRSSARRSERRTARTAHEVAE